MKRSALLAAVALAMIVGAYWFGRAVVPQRPMTMHVGSASGAATDVGTPARSQTSAARSAAVVAKGGLLPASGAPLKETFAGLQARANAGDERVASRLVRDLDRCSRLRAAQWKNAKATDDLTRRSTDGMNAAQLRTYQALLDAMELRQQGVREGESLCADVSDEMIDTLVPNIAQAARLGDEVARACYLGHGPLYDTRSLLAHPETLRSYRNDAMTLMGAGLAAGDWRVVDLLQQAYEPGAQGLLAGMVGVDPVQHYRYLKLYRLGAEAHRVTRIDRQLASAAANLTSLQRADADAWAQTNLRDHFEGDSTSATPDGWEACAF